MTAHKLFNVLVVVLFLFLPAAKGFGGNPIHHGTQNGGTYSYGDVRIRFCVFTFRGLLVKENIENTVNKNFQQMKRDGRTARRQTFSKYDRNRRYAPKFNMREGQIFVLGWATRDGSKSGWLAADKTGIGHHAVHRWISSTGNAGTIVGKNTSHVSREQKTVKMSFQPGSDNDSRLSLVLYAMEGRMTWWMTE